MTFSPVMDLPQVGQEDKEMGEWGSVASLTVEVTCFCYVQYMVKEHT